jgi:predicted MPP superfamily phosphohydrolase
MKREISTPGREGSAIDRLVRFGERVQRLPSVICGIVLCLIAGLGTAFSPGRWIVAGLFVFADWALLLTLPKFRISYGPEKPTILLLALMRMPFLFLPDPWRWIVQAVGTLLVFEAFLIEPQRLQVSHLKLRTAKLARGTSLRLVQIGDLHFSQWTRRDEKLSAMVNGLEPDLILFTGDILSYSVVGDSRAVRAARSIFTSFKVKLGILAVAGSPPIDTQEVLEGVFGGTDIMVLDSRIVKVKVNEQEINITGVSCSHDPILDGKLLALLHPLDAKQFQILLYHSPDLAPQVAKLGFDLQLSGHTHGGQVRFPFFGALYASSIFGKRFEAGRYQLNGMILYVSRGLGLEGKGAPRVRFLCTPEIVLWIVEGTGEKG